MLVGNETHDDAGVFQITDDLALVQTVDFFTPVVDDPYLFGRIAATNSLSDIYAMGGRPVSALNLLGAPSAELSPDVVGAMLRGGQDVMEEAETSLIGGHSIDDTEPKLGYAVTGLVHPGHIWRNSTASPGETVFLTKPVGTGVIIKAIKDGRADVAMTEAAIAMMATSNQAAKEAIEAVGDPGSCTDVTGFGLLGHLWEMAEGAGVTVDLTADAVPLLPGSRALAEADAFPSGSRRNWDFVRPHLTHVQGTPTEALLADAVTSGGLLFTVSDSQAEAIRQSFRDRGLGLWSIGRVRAGQPMIVLR